MKKRYFPLYVDLTDKKVVVIGGGRVAARRVNTLLGFVDKIMVISPELGKNMEELVFQKCVDGLFWLSDVYQKGYLDDADMVLACTDVKVINDIVEEDCRRLEQEQGRRILFSRCDDKNACDFLFPSIVVSEDVVVGINSSGESPEKTKETRERMEEMLGVDSLY